MKIILTLLMGLLVSAPALAGNRADAKQMCAGLTLESTKNCGPDAGIRIRGSNAVSFVFDYTRNVGDGFSCTVEYFKDEIGLWAALTTQAVAAGVITMSSATLQSETLTGNATTTYTLTTSYDSVRLRDCQTVGSDSAGDILNIWVVRDSTDSI